MRGCDGTTVAEKPAVAEQPSREVMDVDWKAKSKVDPTAFPRRPEWRASGAPSFMPCISKRASLPTTDSWIAKVTRPDLE